MRRIVALCLSIVLALSIGIPAFADGNWDTEPVPIEDEDCTHSFVTHIVPASVTKSGRVDTICEKCSYIKSSVKIAQIKGVQLSSTVFYYDGKAKTPSVTVKDTDGKTISKNYYTVSYHNNVKVGKKTYANITFKKYYRGAFNRYFNIYLGKPAVTVKTNESAVKLSWNKVTAVQGYRIYQYNASTGKYTRLADTTALSYTLKNKAAGSTYYYLVRAYFINAAKQTVLSPYAVSDNVKAVTLCKAPAVKAAVSGSTVVLKWGAVSGAKYYRVFAYNAKTKAYTSLANGVTATSYTLKNQAVGTHYYLVRAMNAAGAGSAYGTAVLAKAVVK